MRSRFLDEIPASCSTDRARASSAPAPAASAGGFTARRGSVGGRWRAFGAGPRPGATPSAGASLAYRLGEDVVHAAFGEGVVTGVEPGG
jgi:DNA helicase-2/ATP-dependent DNA helicase PcrA